MNLAVILIVAGIETTVVGLAIYFFLRSMRFKSLYENAEFHLTIVRLHCEGLKTALTFYKSVIESSEHPKLTWEVYEKAMKNELH